MVFVSGQIPLDPRTGEMVEGGAAEQAQRCLQSIDAILRAAGLSRSDVAKVTIYMLDLSAFASVNDTYAAFFGDHRPARATVEVSALPKGAAIELDAIAVRPVE